MASKIRCHLGDFDEGSLAALLSTSRRSTLLEIWITLDQRPDRAAAR